MNVPAGQLGQALLDAAVLLVLLGTLASWVWIAWRLVTRRPLLRYEPRRPVPWGALEIALVLCFFFAVGGLVFAYEQPLLDGWANAHYAGRLTPRELEGLKAEHALLIVLAADPNLPTLAICLVLVAVIAPASEEFFFRLLLQGWLEKLERRLRRPVPALRRLAPGLLAIMTTSAIFAALHFRKARPDEALPNVVKLFHTLVAGGITSTLALVFGLLLLRGWTRASAADLGFVPAKFWTDVRTGLVSALAVIVPLLFLQVGLGWFVHSDAVQGLLQRLNMPTEIATDPIPIFLLALVLGTLYWRTHRLVPGIIVHMALNLTSLTLAWLAHPA